MSSKEDLTAKNNNNMVDDRTRELQIPATKLIEKFVVGAVVQVEQTYRRDPAR